MSRDSRYGAGPPPDITDMYSLKVDNLTYRTSVDDLRRVFSRYGRLGDIYIPRDPYKQESRGFAFIRYYDKRDARDAIDSLDGALLDGRPLRVGMAQYDRPDNPRRKYGNSYNSRRRSRSRSRGRRRRSYSRSRSRSRSRSGRRGGRRGRSDSKSRSKSKSRSRSRSNRAPAGDSKRSISKSKSRSRSRSN